MRPPLVVALLLMVAVVAIQALLLPMFAAPSASLAPRDLPLLVAGPAPAGDELAGQLLTSQPGAFDIRRVPDEAAAQRALHHRQAYAAFVVDAGGVRLYTASAASPAVAQLLRLAADELPAGPVPVQDVVPGSPDDQHGGGFVAGFVPLLLTSVLAGIVLVVLVRGWRIRLAALLAFATLAGLVGAAILQAWLGVLGGDYPANAAAIGLFTLAVAAAVTGLGAAVGGPGIGLGAVLVFLVGNPLSAAASAPELLPQPWGGFGQWLPPGAGATLLRSVAWFGGSGADQALAVLAGWAAVGLILVVIGRARLPHQVR